MTGLLPSIPARGEQASIWFMFKVLALLGLALMTDSYDLQAASFAAPTLAAAWHVPKAAFGPLFGAGLAGVFFGAPLFGWIGDKFGRKRAILFACIAYGGFSLITTLVGNPTEFAVLRFLMGLGCGGALPNVVALATELAPHPRRGMLTSLVFVAMPLGGAIPGYVASGLVPSFGWQAIFVVGGVAPILFAALILLGLPESPVFFPAAKNASAPASPAPTQTTRLTELLSRQFAATTLLLWVMFAGTLLTIYLISNWLPTILHAYGLTPAAVANVNFLYAIGGALSGLGISLVIDRIGLGAVFALYALALVSVVLVAFSEFSQTGLAVTMFFCGFAVTGVQYALNVSAGLIYPPRIRSSGVGAALGVGRIGSVAGAMLGALVVVRQAAGRDLFLVPVLPLAIGIFAVALLMRRRTFAPTGV